MSNKIFFASNAIASVQAQMSNGFVQLIVESGPRSLTIFDRPSNYRPLLDAMLDESIMNFTLVDNFEQQITIHRDEELFNGEVNITIVCPENGKEVSTRIAQDEMQSIVEAIAIASIENV